MLKDWQRMAKIMDDDEEKVEAKFQHISTRLPSKL